MDQLTAYRILRLEQGSSLADIKAAYAALSKEYHPEEHPEEFQKIHEAYVTLTRGNRRGRRAAEEQELNHVRNQETQESQTESREYNTEESQKYDFDGTLQRTQEEDQRRQADQPRQEQSLNFDRVHRQTEEKQQEESIRWEQQKQEEEKQRNNQRWDFDGTLHQAEQSEQERLFRTSQKALIEIEMLLAPENRGKIKLFQRFFKKEEYQEVLRKPMFMGGFAKLLVNMNLKKNIYDYIIDYYRFRGLNPNEMFPEAKALYQVLDQKRGMNAKKKGNVAYVIPIVIISVLRATRRSVNVNTGFGVVIFGIVMAMFLIWLYRALYKNRSSLFAQAMVALVIIVSQFIVLMTDLYVPLMGYENGTFMGALLFLLGVAWLGIVGVVALVKKIGNAARKNR